MNELLALIEILAPGDGGRGTWVATPGPDGADGPWHVHEQAARFDAICQTVQDQDEVRAKYIAFVNPRFMKGLLLEVIPALHATADSIRAYRNQVEQERDILKSTVEAVRADLGIEDDYPLLQRLREVLDQGRKLHEENEALKAENENLRNERRAFLRK